MTDNQPANNLQAAQDPWSALRAFTPARIALGRTGISVPLKESLQFKLAHAHARDAVHASLDAEILLASLDELKLAHCLLKSRAMNRQEYLQCPDKGRRLHEACIKNIESFGQNNFDLVIVIADGLSAMAINAHAINLLRCLVSKLEEAHISLAPVCIVRQGRVGIANEIGELLNARLSLILIGERPGLTAVDSVGAYLTYAPKIGLTDESRNCISNIRPAGLDYKSAADKIFYLIRESLRLKLTGITLKDQAGLIG